MKRKAGNADISPSKRQALEVPEYCDVEPRRDDQGDIIWPAPGSAMEAARSFIKQCVQNKHRTLLVPDKDADGLTSGAILHQTLTTLGLSASLIDVHLLSKGRTVHDPDERSAMASKRPQSVIVLDQGSRPAPPIVDDPAARSLVIDHHQSSTFPEGALVVSACACPPVATSSLLTYELCRPLHPDLEARTGWLCAVGTFGDLGSAIKWNPPFPDMAAVFKEHTKKVLSDAVALLNAPRRTATFDVRSAWDALMLAATSSTTTTTTDTASKSSSSSNSGSKGAGGVSGGGPRTLLTNPRLQAARAEITREVERCTHAAPKFSKDGKIAVLRIRSAAQVHPVIATRWAGHLRSKALEIVLVANDGYLEGMVNFSCRVAKCARARAKDEGGGEVDIIESLKRAADLSDSGLVDRLGESFARGHREASGGIVPAAAFEELMECLEVGVKPDKPAAESSKKGSPEKKKVQKNNLMNYFAKA